MDCADVCAHMHKTAAIAHTGLRIPGMRLLEAICHRRAKGEILVLTVRQVGAPVRLVDVEAEAGVATKVITESAAVRPYAIDAVGERHLHPGAVLIRKRRKRASHNDIERPE